MRSHPLAPLPHTWQYLHSQSTSQVSFIAREIICLRDAKAIFPAAFFFETRSIQTIEIGYVATRATRILCTCITKENMRQRWYYGKIFLLLGVALLWRPCRTLDNIYIPKVPTNVPLSHDVARFFASKTSRQLCSQHSLWRPAASKLSKSGSSESAHAS